MRNVLLTIEYDGSGFHGWQFQPNQRTVQGELEQVLSHITGKDVTILGASRTDAGVHAYGQRATLRGDYLIPAGRIPIAVNRSCEDIKIIRAEEMPEEHHARYDTVGKTYLYRIRTAKEPDIYLRNYRFQLIEALNTGKMKEATFYLIGRHDFSAFRSAGGNEKIDPVKTIYDISLDVRTAPDTKGEPGEEIEIRVTGSGFLYNMVRIIVGTLVDIGRGRVSVSEMGNILEGKDRQFAGPTAPPTGLWLEEIYYDRNEIHGV
jgi:tRNA pseudouridine38-40 synthase